VSVYDSCRYFFARAAGNCSVLTDITQLKTLQTIDLPGDSALHKKYSKSHLTTYAKKCFSRNGATKTVRNAVARCVVAPLREKSFLA